MPVRLNIDTRPVPMGDRRDPIPVANQEAPNLRAFFHDGIVRLPYAVAELVAAQVALDVLLSLEPRSGSRFG